MQINSLLKTFPILGLHRVMKQLTLYLRTINCFLVINVHIFSQLISLNSTQHKTHQYSKFLLQCYDIPKKKKKKKGLVTANKKCNDLPEAQEE